MSKRELSAGATDFIDDGALETLVATTAPNQRTRVREILARSLAKEALEPEETAVLLAADDPELVEEIYAAARRLKHEVYGDRIVLFAPLYVGNHCVNDCTYCGFRRSNKDQVRVTLDSTRLEEQVRALERSGHKRLILVFGEHPDYDAEFIAQAVREVYAVHEGRGEIRRVNVNAAPLDSAGFRIVHEAGIGTYQIFQETYHHATYRTVHPPHTLKGDYLWRLDGLSRAFEAGCDDMGIGALFGLYDWRFEVLGLVSHSRHLFGRYGVGPHTISFPRLQPAHHVSDNWPYQVKDEEFKRLVAILRLSVPYTGMILTARESAEIRSALMDFGVSQIDAGTKLELGGYTEHEEETPQHLEREQFALGDKRELDAVIAGLVEQGHIPSFCTACYRVGRTGEQFMEYAIPGFIERFCTPNALLTLCEYLVDYAQPETRTAGMALIDREVQRLPEGALKTTLVSRLQQIRETPVRDLYF